jgi:predicted membrane channel-forming protein YqfA (hemolysin III family)
MDWSLGDLLWSMVVLFFWVMFIWMFVTVFADVFRRNDLSGASKVLWIVLIVVLPFLGILVYVIARPRMTEQDRERAAGLAEQRRRLEGYAAGDEIAKLTKLRDAGSISAEEFEQLSSRAML